MLMLMLTTPPSLKVSGHLRPSRHPHLQLVDALSV
jgi:hypothetical protein